MSALIISNSLAQEADELAAAGQDKLADIMYSLAWWWFEEAHRELGCVRR